MCLEVQDRCWLQFPTEATGSVREDPSRVGCWRARGRKWGQNARAVPLGMLCLLGDDRSIQVKLSGWDGSVKGFCLFAQAE